MDCPVTAEVQEQDLCKLSFCVFQRSWSFMAHILRSLKLRILGEGSGLSNVGCPGKLGSSLWISRADNSLPLVRNRSLVTRTQLLASQ